MAEVTTMVLKVDLECHKCYRKIKKLLCKYPEIKDQTYSEKGDTVMIKVVCCSPERIRQKLICKGGKTIHSIQIIDPEKPKPPQVKRNKLEQLPNVPAPNQVTVYPPMYSYRVCCNQCFEGRDGGPCHSHHGYGIPYQPQPPSSYDGWPFGCRCDRSYGCRCEYYIENYPPCTIL